MPIHAADVHLARYERAGTSIFGDDVQFSPGRPVLLFGDIPGHRAQIGDTLAVRTDGDAAGLPQLGNLLQTHPLGRNRARSGQHKRQHQLPDIRHALLHLLKLVRECRRHLQEHPPRRSEAENYSRLPCPAARSDKSRAHRQGGSASNRGTETSSREDAKTQRKGE